MLPSPVQSASLSPLPSPWQPPSFGFVNLNLFSSRLTAASSVCKASSGSSTTTPKVAQRKREKIYKPAPGETEGICQEMRFVAMRLRNDQSGEGEGNGETWEPTLEDFAKYLVDSKLVFNTVERIINDSTDVAYVYFRKNGLDRSMSLEKDLEWIKEQGIAIPEPSSPGIKYSKYLEELAETSSPSFLCHYYNIYFSHITGGVGIGKKISEKILDGREMEFYKWDGDVQLLLKDVRESLNNLSQHWPREEKKQCLIEAARSFKYMGQIVRLLISF